MAIILGVTVSIIGAVFQASAMNITWMCCARVVSGLGVGTIDAGEIKMMFVYVVLNKLKYSYSCVECRSVFTHVER